MKAAQGRAVQGKAGQEKTGQGEAQHNSVGKCYNSPNILLYLRLASINCEINSALSVSMNVKTMEL